MTECEWCQRMWPVLIDRAGNGLTINYKGLKETIEFKGWQRTFSRCLGRIANYCHKKGWPILTVIVVNKETGRPGGGIPFVSDFESEQKRVHAFPWHEQRTPASEDFPESACLSGRRIGAEGDGRDKHVPNQAMLNALAEVERIQKGMQPREGKDAPDYLREAKSGGMYGYGDGE